MHPFRLLILATTAGLLARLTGRIWRHSRVADLLDRAVAASGSEDWEYVAEGALNIALRYVGSNRVLQGKILRIRKLNPEANAKSLETANRFVERVMVRLLGREFVPDSHLVDVPRTLLDALEESIAGARPYHRRKHPIDASALHGVIMPDQARVICGCAAATPCTSYAFEIKPKWGFLCGDSKYSVKRRVDRFTMHQQLKRHQANAEALGDLQLSSYNPLELFDGDIAKALGQLESTPQNNFRLFIDGSQRYPCSGAQSHGLTSVSSSLSLAGLLPPPRRASSAASPAQTPRLDRSTSAASPLLAGIQRNVSATSSLTKSPNKTRAASSQESSPFAARPGPGETQPLRVDTSRGRPASVLVLDSSPGPLHAVSLSEMDEGNVFSGTHYIISPTLGQTSEGRGALKHTPSMESFASASSTAPPAPGAMTEALSHDRDLQQDLMGALAIVLRSTGLLERVKSAQRLPPVTDIEFVWPIYQGIPPEQLHALRLDDLSEAEDLAPSPKEIVRRFMVSCTARDCSLMVTLSTCPRPVSKTMGRAVVRGTSFAFDAAVVDLDPKPVEKMRHYFETDQKIAKLYEELERSGKLFL